MRRRRRKKAASTHLSLSTTDADWEMVRAKAARRGLSMARYVVELVLAGDARDGGPMVALDADEQRELLASVRALVALVRGGVDVPELLDTMRRGIDAVIDTWALDAWREGRLEEVRAIAAARYGEAGEAHVERIAALARASGRRSGPHASSGQASLF